MANKKIRPLCAAGAVFVMLLSTGYSSTNEPSTKSQKKSEQVEHYKVETKDVNVTVTNIEKKHWFALTHWYSVKTQVHCDEYNIDDTFEEKGSGILNAPISWDFEVGDVVEAEIELVVDNKTGNIVSHEIDCFW